MSDETKTRREVLATTLAGASGLLLSGCESGPQPAVVRAPLVRSVVSDPVTSVLPIQGLHWQTFDPFLFCAHHDDNYPVGNPQLGPAPGVLGHNIGSDFEGRDGWRMYHGAVVPGFPQHPHRGFETVTVVRRGYVDHSDSMGATARYGGGDVQWLTAGEGIVHAEMFPLLDQSVPNPMELFQLWLNLPRVDKFARPHFSMFWRETIPVHSVRDASGKRTVVTVIAGRLNDVVPRNPPPSSWASRRDSDVAVWTLAMDPGARWTLPPARTGSNRTLYFFRGSSLRVGSRRFDGRVGLRMDPTATAELVNGDERAELLLLQGRPIGEPVAQRGPMVMNDERELQQAFQDYRRTGFGGWPWSGDDPVHPANAGRFALHADGHREEAGDGRARS